MLIIRKSFIYREKEGTMDLLNLHLDKTKTDILHKKKIYTVESFLRKYPLHYYDFTTIYPLNYLDKNVSQKMAEGQAFAITGIVRYSTLSVDQHGLPMFKMQVTDDITRNTLNVIIIGVEQYKYKLLEDHLLNPYRKKINIPDNLNTVILPASEKLSIWKKVMEINNLDEPSLFSLCRLNTKGYDRYSKMSIKELADLLPDGIMNYVNYYCPNNAYYKNQVLRWYARGLRLDLSIYKILLSAVNIETLLHENMHVMVGGMIRYSEDYHSYSVLNPYLITEEIEQHKGFAVQYSQMKGFTPEEYKHMVNTALSLISKEEYLPSFVIEEMRLPSFYNGLYMIHYPSSIQDIVFAKRRTTFEDMLYFALKIESNKPSRQEQAPMMKKEEKMQKYISSLPYELTKGQKDAILEISQNMSDGKTNHSLIQGDVGTGKTCVAFALMLKAVDNGFQAALAAPYTTLASQHYHDFKELEKALNIHVVLLTSEMKAAEKKKALQMIESGEADIIIGTHSIFTDKVNYKNLGIIIQDEEHKFGVIHRKEFEEKGINGCHKLTMSATPIPKSLAETIYGSGTSIITITDKPANRLPIKTAISDSDKACADFIISEVRKHHQAYIVCPAIEQGKKKNKDMPSIEEFETIYRPLFDHADVSMAVLTGKMKQQEKEMIMQDFKDGKIDVLMATTVIEVGINVPNATVMLIVGADRFGFSTLHQLRGRVGRGKAQSYCLLETKAENTKLSFMTSTNDGFKIAEKDLELRGPGTLFGERQSGDNYFVDLMLTYPKIFKLAKNYAIKLLEEKQGQRIIETYETMFLPDNDA